MTTINALLARHNELADALGDKHLSAWKASKAKLAERIADLEARIKPAKASATDALFHLTDLCDELRINAKVARAKMRRLYAKDASALPRPVTRWAWDPADADEVRNLF